MGDSILVPVRLTWSRFRTGAHKAGVRIGNLPYLSLGISDS